MEVVQPVLLVTDSCTGYWHSKYSIDSVHLCGGMPYWISQLNPTIMDQGGYRVFHSNTITLTPKVLDNIHKRGGTILGISLGGHDTTKIVDSIQDRGINQTSVYNWRRWNSERSSCYISDLISPFEGFSPCR